MKQSGDVVTVDVVGERGALHLEADVVRDERRALTGGEPDALLSVNGRDVGREVMAEVLRSPSK